MYQRNNPRVLLLIVVICALAFIFFTHRRFNSGHLHSYGNAGLPSDPDLSARVARSERTYQRTLDGRAELLKRYGPSPSQVVMFPPDTDPWPAYTAWDFFPPTFDCPHELERVGSLGDGGKWICGMSRIEDKPSCIIYVFGLDWASSWEAELLSRTQHCEIWGYDASGAEKFGWQITGDLRYRTHFAQFQLGPKDSHGPDDSPKIYTLDTLMRMNGHSHIDILKIDIEGWEFETMKTLVGGYLEAKQPLPFGQLQIEIHAWKKRFQDFMAWWELLETAGLRPFAAEPNLVYVNYNRQSGAELMDYSLLNIKGENVFISHGEPQPLARRDDRA